MRFERVAEGWAAGIRIRLGTSQTFGGRYRRGINNPAFDPLQRSQRPAPDTRRPVALHGAKNPGFPSGLDMVRHGPYNQF
ncbi:hypothetical protein Bamb_1640 [Burkholderia ambifaria AMMD]|uniref:Uncharacterized protein n=1 Tax=Burkholderia ambifaria (strain ATCC BAA-244 / DSM 16087 / CCUG 44356 / LMG 19182 / AMMD) TaxID=339670 RepID=Q0BF76_BURCM|nr:hypothetical protein Bamb_1640 [Burkholderia ambifaria AMMD]